MVWFFDRDGHRLRYEIRRQADDGGYELVLIYPDGRAEAEQMAEASELLKRCGELVRTLKNDGWQES